MKKSTHPWICQAILLAVLLSSAGLSSELFAQTGTSNVRGTVLDAQGNVIVGARVTLSNTGKSLTRTQLTSDTGGYAFTAVLPGVYRLEAEAEGFKKTVVSEVNALVDTPSNVDLSLEVGEIAQVVEIQTTAAAINTIDASIGSAFESQRIIALPLNARNILGLLSLQPGVTRLGEVNGGRRDQANIMLDGLDSNEQQTGMDIVAASLNGNENDDNKTREGFASVLRINPDAVQEFRVVTSGINSDQGRSSGAQVSLVTKSGTNQFHGSLYEYHRNTVTTSNDWFNNAAGRFTADSPVVLEGRAKAGDEIAPRPKLIRNIFGGTLGGPIVKDRAFFFYSYEGRRDAAEQAVLQPVPTETLRQGIVRYRTTNDSIATLNPADLARLYPGTGGVNPAALEILRSAPLPNTFETGDGLNNAGFRFNAPISTKLGAHISRLDFVLSRGQNLFVRGNYQNDLYGQAPQFPTTPSPNLWVNPKGFVVGHTWAGNANIVNNVRVGLTRQAFSQRGDSNANLVNFRFVYQPFLYQRALNRTTPVWNFTDDLGWVKDSHTFGVGVNVRFVRNHRDSFANSFDQAIINPSIFDASGSSLDVPLEDLAGSLLDTRAAVAAVLGRVSEYRASVIFDKDGTALAPGSPQIRSFATEEYEFYGQDAWKIMPNLTVVYGLRYGLATPVYEQNGLQVSPTVSLGEFFNRRVAGAAAAQPVRDLITLDLAGKANDKPGFYRMDKNNFAPGIAVAWSPDFGDNFIGRVFGRNRSVFRGGFRMLYDRVGSALAVGFDLNNELGFSASSSSSANACDQTTRLCPLLTGLAPDVRNYEGIAVPGSLTFPFTHPTEGGRGRVDTTIDDTLVTPKQYTWNFSIGRELPGGFSLEMSYVGRAGRNLLLVRDIMALNDLRDPVSKVDWYTAAGMLADLRESNRPITSVAAIPYFENLFPGLSGDYEINGVPATLTATQAFYSVVARANVDNDPDLAPIGGLNVTDWTSLQLGFDDASIAGANAFFHPQYAALGTYSSIGSSDYHGGSISLRHRFKDTVAFDFNYTLAKSMDNGSTLESQTATSNFLRNSFNLDLSRSVSEFDVRHSFNANWVAALPFGRDRKFLTRLPAAANALLGGWQLSGIWRYHTGLPAGPGFGAPHEEGTWASNWQIASSAVRIRPVSSDNDPNVADPTGATEDLRPNIFSDPVAAYRSFRSPRAGEVGDLNILRLPAYFAIDGSLNKTFSMPYAEGHQLQFRWEVFNVTNTQPFGAISSIAVQQDPYLGSPGADFGRYIDSQKPVGESRPGRVMQFALRYVF